LTFAMPEIPLQKNIWRGMLNKPVAVMVH